MPIMTPEMQRACYLADLLAQEAGRWHSPLRQRFPTTSLFLDGYGHGSDEYMADADDIANMVATSYTATAVVCLLDL